MLTVLLLILMLSLQAWHPLGCLEEERIALLHLKHSLNYPNGTSLPSWRIAHASCCSWESIICDSSTGRVTALDLGRVRSQELGDWYLNASLFLPFQQLKVLSLHGNSIAGWVENKGFLDLMNLEYLDLSYNTLNNSIFQAIEIMTSLKTLKLEGCSLNGQIPTTQGFLDLMNLEYLDLSYNTLNNSIFQAIGTMTSLKILKLEGCNLNGQIPTTQGFLNLKNLEYLDLSLNTLDNNILQSIGTMTSLKTLILGSCKLDGQIPTAQGKVDDSYSLSRLCTFY
uniref:Leucine-rich repeat-containing N-terminal plant-type domain-containing protein n=1 Tax=Populus alba TaxID=43335 RepID=A0A4U5PVD0_POPAL|nr:hypothetical protein D5086_0000179260 [Populus alba]